MPYTDYSLMVDAVGVEPTLFLMSQIYSLLPSPLGTHIQKRDLGLSPRCDPGYLMVGALPSQVTVLSTVCILIITQ